MTILPIYYYHLPITVVMLLSNSAILRHKKKGNIVIDPFRRRQLATVSYDVTLGAHYYREAQPQEGYTIYNPYSKREVERVWGKKYEAAQPLKEWIAEHGTQNRLLEGIKPNDRVIWIAPGETILCHTEEFIGGTGGIVTTMMKARSSWGRNFIEVCKCAGWGDVGYINRWTMEITSNSRYYHIPLVVGRRIAQIVFFEVEPILGAEYHKGGKYQSHTDLARLKKEWNPTMMLPRLYRDYEIRKRS